MGRMNFPVSTAMKKLDKVLESLMGLTFASEKLYCAGCCAIYSKDIQTFAINERKLKAVWTLSDLIEIF